MENIIRELRTGRGWSQQFLADELGVSRQTVNAIENGRSEASLELALKLGHVFGRDVEELFLPEPRGPLPTRSSG